MKVTVIGTGNMGSAFVKQLTRAGHQVSVTGRDLPKAAQLAAAHPGAVAVPIGEAVPGAEVVKAFNTLFAQVLNDGPDFGAAQKATVFYASDSKHAGQTAATLAESMGYATIDAGGLRTARYLEPLAGLNVYLGYGAGRGTGIAPTWLQKA